MKTFVEPMPSRISISSMLLDPDNPRLILEKRGKTNADLIEALCRLSNGTPHKLVKNILSDSGYHLNSSPVLMRVKGSRKYIVVDGNRRMAAMMMILNPSLVPSTRRGLLADCERARGLVPTKLPCWIALSNSDAAIIKFRAHNEGSQEWETLCKYSVYYENFQEGESISSISEKTGKAKGEIVKAINTWILVSYMLENIKGFVIDSTGITSFERVTTTYRRFPAKMGFGTTQEGVYQIPESTDLPELLHRIYLSSAKISSFSRVVDNDQDSKEKFISKFVPTKFSPTPKEPPVGNGGVGKDGAPVDPVAANVTGLLSGVGNRQEKPLMNSRREQSPFRDKDLIGAKSAKIYEELTSLKTPEKYPITSGALTRCFIENVLKHWAKRLGCYQESQKQQQRYFSGNIGAIAQKLRDYISSAGLPFSSDLNANIMNLEAQIEAMNHILHKDGVFSDQVAVENAWNSLRYFVKKIPAVEPN